MRVITIILLVLMSFLAGCNSEEKNVTNAVKNSLIDQDSAKFKGFQINKTETKACILVNAKNRMGGYTGFSVAELEKINSKWNITSMDGNFENCSKIHFDIRDHFEEFRKKFPKIKFVEVGDYIPDDALDKGMFVIEEYYKTIKGSGVSIDDFQEMINNQKSDEQSKNES